MCIILLCFGTLCSVLHSEISGISKCDITTDHLIKSWLPEKLSAGFFPVLLPKVLDRVGRMEQGKALLVLDFGITFLLWLLTAHVLQPNHVSGCFSQPSYQLPLSFRYSQKSTHGHKSQWSLLFLPYLLRSFFFFAPSRLRTRNFSKNQKALYKV